ncbi:ABC transporter ATP-binding protein [Vreelandella janggokensis]|uniref:ABC transporter ATP-binding protein n=1 Tax=Vreelandella janggokensis TaxID=370767 RepID=UPI00285A8898|nr:ABC transporter ATP-binding protein [Halomonas janggokensis]MDR5886429.1 ABC transporter ATP-binding protein [Halomonas janggokensis]
MLELSHLSAGYGRLKVLNDLNFTVEENSCVGILGRNGTGKTTLLRALAGEISLQSGHILLDGKEPGPRAHQRARAGIGYVPQGRQIFPQLTVAENLRMGCVKQFAEASTTVDEMLELFPRLKRLLDQPGGALSGGEQQLLSLARCLCGRPSLILLDEPTEGIQPSICDEIIDTLKLLRERKGLTVVLVEQDIEFLTALSDRILVLDKGTLIEEIDPRQSTSQDIAERLVGFH